MPNAKCKTSGRGVEVSSCGRGVWYTSAAGAQTPRRETLIMCAAIRSSRASAARARGAVLAGVACLLLSAAPPAAGRTYHLDCTSGSDDADGTSPERAWRSLDRISKTTFAPGDEILLRRGTRCAGILWPKGSGREGTPIRIGAYGTGALPIVDAGGGEAAVKLFEQQYWVVEHVEAVGGNPYGVYVGGANGSVRHIRLRNLLVRDVTGTPKTKVSGLVVVSAGPDLRMEDIEIDGVTAFNTTQWAGILVRGGSRENRARHVVVRNSVVHHVFGDGIVLFQVEDGLIEKSAAWLTGLEPVQTIGTPNGIWTWRCRRCTVQLTQGFYIDSPGIDGGVYDIDWGCDDNIVQHNFAHDSMGYCASVFGASNEVTTNSIVRYNVCVDNGRSPKLARRQGDIYLSTWDGGALDGVLIHNNTIIWNPPIDVPAVNADGIAFTGSRPNLFVNNIIASSVPSLVHSSGTDMGFRHNLYWYGGRGAPVWSYGGRRYGGFDEYATAAGPAAGERFAPPAFGDLLSPRDGSPLLGTALRLPQMGAHDAFGTSLLAGEGAAIGAIQGTRELPTPTPAPHVQLDTVDGTRVSLTERHGRWLLLLIGGAGAADARSQLVFVQAAMAQYGRHALDAVVAYEDGAEAVANLRHDWHLGDVDLLAAPAAARAGAAFSAAGVPTTVLVSPEGQVVRRWEGFVAPAALGLALRHHLGAPGASPIGSARQARPRSPADEQRARP
jgi:hypothetical protein